MKNAPLIAGLALSAFLGAAALVSASKMELGIDLAIDPDNAHTFCTVKGGQVLSCFDKSELPADLIGARRVNMPAHTNG